ncbi:MAG: hypothetical protein FWG63_03260 [Defluviitaleaceae bacterium]|nr:hypothetical protein [Defluviitaleaceae bacterium]
MANASELLRQEAKENEIRRILLLIEKLEKDGKTLKDLKELMEAQLEK